MIVAFVGFSRIFLMGILIFEGRTARRFHKSFGVKGLNPNEGVRLHHIQNVLQFDGGDGKEIRIDVLSEGGKGIVEAYRR
jgi:hypothetical protein